MCARANKTNAIPAIRIERELLLMHDLFHHCKTNSYDWRSANPLRRDPNTE